MLSRVTGGGAEGGSRRRAGSFGAHLEGCQGQAGQGETRQEMMKTDDTESNARRVPETQIASRGEGVADTARGPGHSAVRKSGVTRLSGNSVSTVPRFHTKQDREDVVVVERPFYATHTRAIVKL